MEISKPSEIPKRCPACDADFRDAVDRQGGGTGLTTANTTINLYETND